MRYRLLKTKHSGGSAAVQDQEARYAVLAAVRSHPTVCRIDPLRLRQLPFFVRGAQSLQYPVCGGLRIFPETASARSFVIRNSFSRRYYHESH